MSAERTDLESRMIRRRLNGLNVPPARNPDTDDPYPVTYKYGIEGDEWAAGHHTGEDYRCPTGSLAVSVSWGTVLYIGTTVPGGWSSKGAYGLHIIVRSPEHDIGWCHLSAAKIMRNQFVRPGTILGLTGESGNASGPHLHFEARPIGGLYGSDVHPGYARNRTFAP